MQSYRKFLFPLALASVLAPAWAIGPVVPGGGYRVQIENDSQGPLPADAGAVDALKSVPTTKDPWKATWDSETGRVRMLHGGLSPASTATADAHALQFLTAHKALFGLKAAAEVRKAEVRSTNLGAQVRFQQYYKGVRVFPGDLNVSRNKKGQIFLVSSGFRPDLSLPTQPAVTKTEAKQLAATAAGGKLANAGAPELIVWGETRPFRLAWQVDVLVRHDRDFRVTLDAATGRLIRKFNLVTHQAGNQGNVYLGNSVSTPNPTTVPLNYLDGSGSLKGQFVTVNKFTSFNAEGNAQGAPDLKSGADGFKLAATDPRFNQTMMYYHVTKWHDYFKTSFNFTQWDKSMAAFVDVKNNDGTPLNNAYFSFRDQSITFGSLGTGQDLALDSDVIGHEYTHAVVNTQNEIGQNDIWTEARALNEATADYFSATVQGEPCMGEYATGKTDGSCGRDLSNRSPYPDAVSESVELKDGSKLELFPEEHHTGKIWGAAMWDLRRALGAPLSDKIIFNSLKLYPKTATFSDARVAVQTADQTLGTGKLDVIKQIFQNRGIPEQAIAQYAEPFRFSPGQQQGQTILTGFLSPEGGPISPTGFLPVFVKGKTYLIMGLTDIADVKDIVLVFLNGNTPQKTFVADLSDVKVTTQNGQVPVKRFQINALIPNELQGNFDVAIAYSTDGQTLKVSSPLAGKVIAPTPAAPAPPGEVVTPPTTPNEPTPTPPPPVVPKSLVVSPLTASVSVGAEKEFKATVTDTENKVLPNATVNWSVEGNAGVGAVSANGIFTAKTAGTVTLIGRVGAAEGRATVTVTPAFTPTNVNTWRQVGGSEQVQVLGLGVGAAGGQTYLYGTGPNNVGLSVNRQAFTGLGNGITPGTIPYSIAVNPMNPQTVYIGTIYGGIFKSVNGGQSFQQYAEELGFLAPSFSTLMTDEQDELLAGTLAHGAFFRGGANQPWQTASNGLTTATLYSVLLTDTALYAGTNSGVFRVLPNQPWTAANNGLVGSGFGGQNTIVAPVVTQLAADPKNKQRLIAATDGDGVFLTENGGDLWKASNNGLKSPSVLTVAFDPVKANRLFAGTNGAGVYVSNDGGLTWEAARGGLKSGVVTSIVFDPTNPNLLYAGTYGDGVWYLDLNGEIVSESFARANNRGYGDVNADTQINVSDAVLVLQASVGLKVLEAAQKDAADVNRDAKQDVQDAVLILRTAVGVQ